MTVEIYTKSWCPFCHRAKALLDKLGMAYREHDVTTDETQEREMRERSGRRTVPQVFIDNYHVGGFDDLHASYQSGELFELLADSDRVEGAVS